MVNNQPAHVLGLDFCKRPSKIGFFYLFEWFNWKTGLEVAVLVPAEFRTLLWQIFPPACLG